MSVIFSLLKTTSPDVDLRFPAIKLNKVVFPDPFGPIIPVIDPSLILSEHFETAASPPKYLDRLFTCKIFSDIEIYFLRRLRTLFVVIFKDLKNPDFLNSFTACSFNPRGV